MKRSEFIRKSLLGLIGATVVTSTPVKLLIGEPIKKHIEPYIRKTVQFKITEQLIANKEWFETEIEEITKKYFNLEKAENIEVEIGLMDDDFMRQIYTVRLTSKQNEAPRLSENYKNKLT